MATHKPLRDIHFEHETAPATGSDGIIARGYLAKISSFATLRPLVILNAVPARGDRHEQAKAVLDRLRIPVCPHTIGSRSAFGDSAALGQTPQEYDPEGKAAEEIRQAYKYTRRLVFCNI